MNELLRRRCPECGQLVVTEVGETVACPGCGTAVTDDHTEPPQVVERETLRASNLPGSEPQPPFFPPGGGPDEGEGQGNDGGIPLGADKPEEEAPVGRNAEAESQHSETSPPRPPTDHLDEPSWNMGRPMHQVFYLALVKPDVVPLVTISRSLRWVMAFGILTSMLVFIAEIGVHQQVSPIAAEQEALLKVYEAVTNRSPEERRLIRTNRWLCDLSTLVPEQRLACVLSDLAQGREHPELARNRRKLEEQQMIRLDAPGFWGLLVWLGGPVLFFFRIVPLWLVLALTAFREPWALATRIIAFVTPALVVATVATWGVVWLLGVNDPQHMVLALLHGAKNVWIWTLTALLLLRMRPSAQGQITKVIILYILLQMMPACLGMGA